MRPQRNTSALIFLLMLGMVSAPASPTAASKRPSILADRQREGGFVDGTYPGIWNDEVRRARSLDYLLHGPHVSFKSGALNTDQGNIAVIEDDGTIVLQPNVFDLDNSNIRFSPNGSSYLVSKIGKNFDPATGSVPVPGTTPPGPALGDDDATQVFFTGGFTFSFFGQTYASVWVGSDGHLTFGSGDATSDDRDVDRFVSRQPRIGPLFTDLLPPCGGTVTTLQENGRFVVLWNDVPNFTTTCTSINRDHNTFEAVLFADGSIEFSYNGIGSSSAVVGIAPGNSSGLPPAVVDYTTLSSPTPEPGVVVEGFSTATQVSNTALGKKFYQTHGDSFDFITMMTNFTFDLGGAFAFEINVKNDATGLGQLPVFDLSSAWGSQGRLTSFLNLGPINDYPPDPNTQFLGTNSTVEVIGQEFGHRWMAFDDIPGAVCDPTTNPQTFANSILGRDCAHWSFFFNSHGSVMEGNDIVDNGNGTFTTQADATSRYSALDQYLMGLLGASSVDSAFPNNNFVVFNPTGTGFQNGHAPQAQVTFGGTRHNTSVNDIIAANGLRTPTPDSSQKSFRQAWVLLVQRNTTPSTADLAKVDTIRQAWQSFFSTGTGGRGNVDTGLASGALTAQVAGSGGITKTSGQGPFSVTYGQVNDTTTSPPVALAIFGLTQNGALVTEAGVPAVTTATSARVFVDYDKASGRDGGVALVNPGTNPLTINVSLQDQNGGSSTCPSMQVPAQGHRALFDSQFACSLLNGSNAFLGTLTFTAAAPFAAVNLLTARNGRGEQIFSVLPVVDPTITPAGTNLIFSQVVDGGGNPTQIFLMNTSGSQVSGTISLFDDSGNAVALDFGAGLVSSLPYSIPANGVQKFSTTGQGSLKVAYCVVTPSSGQLPSGAVIFGSRGSTGVASQAGVLNAVPTTSARVYIERSSAPLNRNTGIAMVNWNAQRATVTLNLVSLDGSFNQTVTTDIGSNGHVAQFIDQLFSAGLVPADFKGVLTLTSNVPITVVTLRLTNNQRGDEIFSTLPVADLNAPPTDPLYIPQVVDGGGYTTQLILINTASGAGTVTITFLNDNGSQVPVPFF